LHTVQESKDPARARRTIAESLPPVVASALTDKELEGIRERLVILKAPTHKWLELTDVLGCALVFLLVFLSTFPVVVPFLVVHEPRLAIRVSNGVALLMLFVCGMRLGRYAGHGPWRMGLLIAALGGVLVAVTIALGG